MEFYPKYNKNVGWNKNVGRNFWENIIKVQEVIISSQGNVAQRLCTKTKKIFKNENSYEKFAKIKKNSGNNNQKGQNAMIMQAGIRMQVGIFLKFNKNVVPNKGMQEGKFP